ncbi:glycosyltransferase family 2 protein [Candidatus Woesearchaeota archaeon]|nr:glycosyltransferase family 2 protein [Candidatus Woesearchaeota archaeon]
MTDFTIFIPVYNEELILEKNIARLIDYLNKLNSKYEIIIGSNGSTDKTNEIGSRLQKQHNRLTFFSLPEKGVGKAFKKGVELAKSDKIISLDMDLSVEIDFVEKALELFNQGNDIIIGSKQVGEQKRSFARLFLSSGFIFLTQLLLGIHYTDYSLAAKAYKREHLLKYIGRIDHGTGYVYQMIYYAKKDNKKVIEIPVKCHDVRESRFNIVSEIFYRFFNLFKVWFNSLFRR